MTLKRKTCSMIVHFPPKSSTPFCFVIERLLLLYLSATETHSHHNEFPDLSFMPRMSDKTYSIKGDINIGALVSVKSPSGSVKDSCSKRIPNDPYLVSNLEQIAFAVDVVNKNKNILPNVTLGFITVDYCRSNKVALATSISFIPRAENSCNDTVCHSHTLQSEDSHAHSHDVIGVLAPPGSETTIPISTLYGVAHLPLIAHVTTSDELSNKFNHPYFFRVVPPDKYTVQAILKFIHTNGWSYVSVIYRTNSYGENAFESMKLNVGKYGICIAMSHRVTASTNFDEVVGELLEHAKARVVVLFLNHREFTKLLQGTINQNVTGNFIWLGSGPLARYAGNVYKHFKQDPGIGAFTFNVLTKPVPEYYEFLRNQTLTRSRNPWLKRIWEYLFECSFRNKSCDRKANVLESGKVAINEAASLKIDSVLAFAHAAHNLLLDKCPDARGTEARACISGELLLEYLKNVSFEGYTDHVKFDKNQEVRGKYVIRQFVHGVHKDPFVFEVENDSFQKKIWKKNIAVYDLRTDTILYLNETISWSHLNNLSRIVPWSNTSSISTDVPESVCSRPCLIYEYKIEKELPCCWECRVCRENERIVEGNTTCEKCPKFEWPDSSTAFRTCSPIPLTYSKPDHLLPVTLISLSVLVITITILVFIGYVVYRNERVVKAGSLELSLCQLFAIFVGYITILVFQIKPTDETCGAIYIMFTMSFASLYSPLLVKTIRIYRIFLSGKTRIEPLRCISPQTQLTNTACLVGVQIILCMLTYSISKPTAHKNQPIWSEKFVELSCDLTVIGLTSFLSYNLILVSLCSIFAFKTRKLPDNFNESRFISMCVSTTLVIWLAFIPTYFTADRQRVRILLLSTALLLNHTVALLFLFVPKVYAAKFLPSEIGRNINVSRRNQSNVFLFASNANRVAQSLQLPRTQQSTL